MANRSQLYKYRGNKCAHCGMSVDDMVNRYGTFNRMFELHHVIPETKHHDYKNLIKREISAEQINEVDKCLLLCRQCHGIIHAQDIQGTVKVTITIDSRTVSQEFHGWFVVDNSDNKFTFITNEKSLLHPCLVKVGDDEEKLYCMIELQQDERLITWLRNIGTTRTIQVWTPNKDKLLLDIYHVKNNSVMIKHSLDFTAFAMDFDVSQGNSSYLWLRNGMVLTKEGEVITDGEVCYPVDLKL